MDIEQLVWTAETGWDPEYAALGGRADLVLVFAATPLLERDDLVDHLHALYRRARICSVSTAGEIVGSRVQDDSLVATAIAFESSRLEAHSINLSQVRDSFAAGARLAAALPAEGLVHVLLLSDGLSVNGSSLVQGMAGRLGARIAITGGLAGDGDRFRKTLVSLDSSPRPGNVVALGLYGDRLRIGFGSMGGWDSFGPERLVTRSWGNVLGELDGLSALALYKRYLGDQAAGLPASGLLFPLSLRAAPGGIPVVRTILGVDEESQTMTFAGDVPEGSYVRLMKANFDRLIDGAAGAAHATYEALGSASPQLAILISCVGRKLVLKQRVEEEVESVQEVLGAGTVAAGFYSYGEISPFTPEAACELHNQTMTITALSER
jgi:hypothetical protein